ncbi:uncharacterized protein [Haliotis asinina]|uniref:uncharacterized protein n=1 Tax=Haliotis asinina TaxID=109174 RepID=UPI003531E662
MEKLSFDRVRSLLDILPRRGSQAYSLFCKALRECGEIEAMTLLGFEIDKQMTELQDPRCHLHLGDNVYVTAKTWDDVLSIHVKYEVYPSGMAYPTKRGIVLSLKHWMELPGAIRFIEEAVKWYWEVVITYTLKLGENIWLRTEVLSSCRTYMKVGQHTSRFPVCEPENIC